MTEQDQYKFTVQRIFLKDASFEVPHAPSIFRDNWQPENSVMMNSAITGLDPDTFEVVLSITLTAKNADRTLFVAEVHQAGIFTITGFSEAERSRLLGAYCPHVLFAYANEAITNLATKGSFPQVVLQPVNFDALFTQHQEELLKRPAGVKNRHLN